MENRSQRRQRMKIDIKKIVKRGYIRWVHPVSHVIHFFTENDIVKGEYLWWGKALCGVEIECTLGSSYPIIDDLYCKRCIKILKRRLNENPP